MSKVTKKQLQREIQRQERRIDNLVRRLAENGIERQPQLKQLDHSIFDGLDEKWQFAAVNVSGALILSTHPIEAMSGSWVRKRNLGKLTNHGLGYDTTNWQNSLIKREFKPQLKQLDQSVFDGLDEKWRFAAVDSDGSRAVFTSDNITQAYGKHYVKACSGDAKQVLGRVDASNWQNSLIERHTAKELTGSDLCREVLKTRRAVARVSDISDFEAADLSSDNASTAVLRQCDDGLFYTTNGARRWFYAVLINNQGEPLTAAEAGF